MDNTKPHIIEEEYNGRHEISMETYFLNRERRIFLFGEIDEDKVNNLVFQLIYLQSVDREEPITLVINSAGGSVQDGMVLVDLIENSKTPIDVYVCGKAMSMAAVILASAGKGHRYMLPSSQVLIHEPRMLQGAGGTASEILVRAESISAIRDLTSGILAKHTGHTVEEINSLIKGEDVVFSAEEALQFGIIDDIVTRI